jgi:hypothetical protein
MAEIMRDGLVMVSDHLRCNACHASPAAMLPLQRGVEGARCLAHSACGCGAAFATLEAALDHVCVEVQS